MLGVIQNKHIPACYLRGSINQRLDLLAGLMDSDGTVDAWGRCEFSNTNKALVDGVAELVRSLGCGVTIQFRKSTEDKRGGHWGKRKDHWRVCFTPDWCPFKLQRKADKIINEHARRNHYIIEVEEVEPRRTVCIETDGPSHMFLVSESMIPTHNSVLRNCYVSWYYKKHLEELEAITGERDATGYPVMYAPPGLWAPGKESTLASWQSKVTAIRKDEQQGMLLPAEYDEQGNPLYKFELVKSAGSGAIDLGAVINRHRLDIASTILADWLMVGHESQGSRALSTDKTEIWADSLRGWMQGCADVFNLHGIPRLFRVNKWEREKYPTLVPGRIGKQDAEGLSLIAKNLAQAGGVILPETINAILRAADLPEQEEEDMMPEVAPPMPQLPPVVDPNQPIPQNQNGGEG